MSKQKKYVTVFDPWEPSSSFVVAYRTRFELARGLSGVFAELLGENLQPEQFMTVVGGLVRGDSVLSANRRYVVLPGAYKTGRLVSESPVHVPAAA